MDFFEKIETLKNDLSWNIPERKQGSLNIVGGNSQTFRSSIKISEYLGTNFPVENLNTILPDALQPKLPPLPNFIFLPSTDSGSFADEKSLLNNFNSADFNLLIGDFSKNSITKKAVTEAIEKTERPLLLTRDSVDLLSSGNPEVALMNQEIIFFASLAQLQSLLRAVYYPKMLLLSESLIQVAEILHKFTLSYPVKIITLHAGQLLLAENGLVKSVALEKSGQLPLTIWSGELAAKIVAYNLFSPNNFLDASISAIFSN